MKRFLSLLTLAILLLISSAQPALAFDPFGTACSQSSAASGSAICNRGNVNGNPITDTIIKVTHIVAIVAGAAAVIIMIFAGLQFISSQGEADKANKARQTIIGGAIGLAIIVLAQGIITYVIGSVLK